MRTALQRLAERAGAADLDDVVDARAAGQLADACSSQSGVVL